MSCSSKKQSSSSEDDNVLRRGPWTVEEDNLLVHYIAIHGEGRWNLLAKRSGLRRNGKSCRLRWLNYLKPDVKRGNLSAEEQLLILDLHLKWGNRWSKIAQYLPGRTDNEIKNYWRTRVQKQAKHLNIDTDSIEFQNIIRLIWMPRLLQKIDQPPSCCSSSSSSSLESIPNLTQNPSALNPQILVQHKQEQTQDFPLQEQPCINQTVQKWEHNEHVIGINDYNTYVKDLSFLGNYNNGYEMETLNMANTSATATATAAGEFGDPVGHFYKAEMSSLIDNDFAGFMWNMDELWEFRN